MKQLLAWLLVLCLALAALPALAEKADPIELPEGDALNIDLDGDGALTLTASLPYTDLRGWGWLVDGMPEDECFEYVPYAD